jgi:FkbM family methyltransferase
MPFLNSSRTRWVAVEPNSQNLQYVRTWEYAANVTIFSSGLSRTGGLQTLYVTNTDSGSSLYPPEFHPSFSHRGLERGYFFPLLERSIETSTLEAVIQRYGHELPVLVKLDTQGTELDILHGASDRFHSHQIIGVEIEAPLLAHPVMKGSGKFWEASRDLENWGYELLEIRPIPCSSLSPLEQKYGKRPVWECDAVFALQRDRAMGLPKEFKAALVVFYLAYEYFEEAYAFLRDDRETRDFMGQLSNQDPLTSCGVLLGIHE